MMVNIGLADGGVFCTFISDAVAERIGRAQASHVGDQEVQFPVK